MAIYSNRSNSRGPEGAMTELLESVSILAFDRAVVAGTTPSVSGRRRTQRYVMSAALRRYLDAKYLDRDPGRVADEPRTVRSCAISAASTVTELRAPWRNERWTGRHAVARRALAAMKVVALGLTLALFALLALVGQARAAELVLASDAQLISGSLAKDYSFDAQSAGMMDVTLTDFKFPTSLTSLVLSITGADDVLLTMSGSGQDKIDVGPGTYYAHLITSAGGALDVGAYGLLVTFEPLAPVPLPASLSLLLAGLAAVAWSLRRQRGGAQHEPTADAPPSHAPAVG